MPETTHIFHMIIKKNSALTFLVNFIFFGKSKQVFLRQTYHSSIFNANLSDYRTFCLGFILIQYGFCGAFISINPIFPFFNSFL